MGDPSTNTNYSTTNNNNDDNRNNDSQPNFWRDDETDYIHRNSKASKDYDGTGAKSCHNAKPNQWHDNPNSHSGKHNNNEYFSEYSNFDGYSYICNTGD